MGTHSNCLTIYVLSRNKGWLGETKVLCILCHRGVQLRLAYSWARPAVLAAGKGRGFFFFSFSSISSLSLCPLTPPTPTPRPKVCVCVCVGGAYCFLDGSRWRRCKTSSSCLLCNLNTLLNILMILGRNVDQEEMTCHIHVHD